MALLDRVKFDGPPDVLVWKWPSDSLALGAQLIVNESQEALFYKNGQALDLFKPGNHTLTTGNLPFLQKIVNLPFGGKTPFAAEIYFISTAIALGQEWGTKTPFLILDPRYGTSIPLRAYGQFGLRVTNAREFVAQIAGASGGGTRASVGAHLASASLVANIAPVMGSSVATTANDVARNLLESLVITCVQSAIGTHLQTQKASVLDLPAQVLALASSARELLQQSYQTFGVELVNFTLESVNFDPKDEEVKKLRSMLSEAARLDHVGDAFRRNQDFYRAERQFDVMQGAAEGGGAAGALMGGAMGLGIGLAAVPTATAAAHAAMTPSTATVCKCGASYKPGARFCGSCGSTLAEATVCPSCRTANASDAKFCNSCGVSLAARGCPKCGTQVSPGTKFCASCGERL